MIRVLAIATLLMFAGCGKKGPTYAESVQTLNAEQEILKRLAGDLKSCDDLLTKFDAERAALRRQFDAAAVDSARYGGSLENAKAKNDGFTKKMADAAERDRAAHAKASAEIKAKIEAQQKRVDAAIAARDAAL